MSHAYCWRGGQIEIGRRRPSGAMPLARGDARILRRVLSACARHAYDGTTLLVPGVPEAANDTDALEAVKRFSAWFTTRSPKLAPAWTPTHDAGETR
jgi:hypothetical protein